MPRLSTTTRALIASAAAVATGIGLGGGTALAGPSTSHVPLSPNSRFYTPPPPPGSVQQAVSLLKAGDFKDAARLAEMITTPQAVWFTGGTPGQVTRSVRDTVQRAKQAHRVPVLVLYNVPGRDCSQYSSGGAGSDPAYLAWIDGVVRGLGDESAVVIVEPDGLANLPSDCPGAYPGGDIAALTAGRIADIKYAGEQTESHDVRASVYLDAGHSAWHSAGDMSSRLYQAGVGGVQGFSLNVSNYQFTVNSDDYGTWLSECLALATPVNSQGSAVNAGDFGDCGDEYYNGGPATNWAGGAMNPYAQWSSGNPDLTLNTAGVESRYALLLGTVKPTAHFVVDTSRNGNGPNNMATFANPPFNQPANVISSLAGGNWCNNPAAGLGVKPTASTGVPLLDAYLWVKTPGQSDGQCDIAGGARAWDYTVYNPWNWNATQQAQNDPLWGIQDPAAGAWFPQMALALVKQANPPL
ncbi:MAG: endoglucanase [Actinomycetota bacterium]|nr:endoglucanase [Actinomycetota bacterium]